METNYEKYPIMFMYGLLGAGETYKPARFYSLYASDIADGYHRLAEQVSDMMYHYPNIEHIYVIANRPYLRKDYMRALTSWNPADRVQFKDMLETEGWEINISRYKK